MERWKGAALAVALSIVPSLVPSFHLSAQNRAPAATPALPPDSTRPIRPMGAFWRSFLFPGWGQAATGRHTAGAVFVAWEGVTAMMTLKAHQEANHMKAIGSGNLDGKRQEVEDWLVLWVFNHLFAGAEAYVSAHLQDFPEGFTLRAYPGGIGVRVPLP